MRQALSPGQTDVVIIGAGPYGLSIAAHLRGLGVDFRIFGSPMQSWHRQMPKGMMLKSDGFASSLYDPGSTFTLRHFCNEQGYPYDDIMIPVTREIFVEYGLEFQRRLVPNLEETDIVSVRRVADGFELLTKTGEQVSARRVVVAAGITHFGHLPPFLSGLPRELASHSLENHDLGAFAGRSVAVIGAGSSAVDMAALLHENGAQVQLVGRRATLAFHSPSAEPRPLHQRLMAPRSGLGIGWRSRLCTDAPLVFYLLPPKLRVRIVRGHLGPSAGWFVRDKVVGHFPVHLGTSGAAASVEVGKVRLQFTGSDGQAVSQLVDHVIGATGFRVSVARLKFLDGDLQERIETLSGAPVVSSSFESSVPGLYFVGLASANAFGPLTRFACGAKFTAERIASHLVKRRQKATIQSVLMRQRTPQSGEMVSNR